MVCDAGGLLKHAYFPQGSVLSLLTVLENGAAIETANIGREGAFGLFAAMYSRVSFNRCIVQLEAHTVRCPIQILQYEFKNSEHVRDLVRELLGNAALTGPADSRLQFNAHDRREDLPLAADDARQGRRRSTPVYARISLPHTRRQSEIRDACRAVDANSRPHQLSSGNYSSHGSSGLGEGVVRMLRHRQGAFRRVPDAAVNRGTRT